jgi:hypothetical protein
MFILLKTILKLIPGGSSNAVPVVNTQDGPTTLSNGQTILKIERKSMTIDGVFGEIWINGEFVCLSAENLSLRVSEGLYDAVVDHSPRLGYECPHIRVPDRDLSAGEDAGIRIHIANKPSELEGCIAPGTILDGDAIDNSRVAFEKMMALLPPAGVSFKVLVYTLH